MGSNINMCTCVHPYTHAHAHACFFINEPLVVSWIAPWQWEWWLKYFDLTTHTHTHTHTQAQTNRGEEQCWMIAGVFVEEKCVEFLSEGRGERSRVFQAPPAAPPGSRQPTACLERPWRGAGWWWCASDASGRRAAAAARSCPWAIAARHCAADAGTCCRCSAARLPQPPGCSLARLRKTHFSLLTSPRLENSLLRLLMQQDYQRWHQLIVHIKSLKQSDC